MIVKREALLEALRYGAVIMGDKAYDADAIIEHIQSQGAAPNIPIRSNRNHRRCFSKALYGESDRIERFFNKIKHFRRIAIRYEKLMLRIIESTT